jgi:hypothetical protein
MRDYSERRDERLGRIKLLEDTNHDGRFDKASVLCGQAALADGGDLLRRRDFVGATPDILFCKDTNGDNVADVSKWCSPASAISLQN